MNFLLLPLMALAGAGLALTAVLHVAALAGHMPALFQPFSGDRGVVAMAGLFVVWVPAVFVAQRIEGTGRRGFSWKRLLSGCPAGLRHGMLALFVYAFVNFFIALGGAADDELRGIRIFSGHAMLFYGAALCVFVSAWRLPGLLVRARCPAGHDVDRGDRYCPACGLPVARSGDPSA